MSGCVDAVILVYVLAVVCDVSVVIFVVVMPVVMTVVTDVCCQYVDVSYIGGTAVVVTMCVIDITYVLVAAAYHVVVRGCVIDVIFGCIVYAVGVTFGILGYIVDVFHIVDRVCCLFALRCCHRLRCCRLRHFCWRFVGMTNAYMIVCVRCGC